MKILNRVLSACWFARGAMATQKRQYSQALNYYDRAIKKDGPTPLLDGYRAITLLLDGQSDNARTAFRELAQIPESEYLNDEYARIYALMYVAYIDGNLLDADCFAADLKEMPCRWVKRILIPIERPSLLAANALLDAWGIETADPLGFREDRSGVHWLNAIKAYGNNQHVEALDHVVQGEIIRSPSPAQKALKACILIHLDRSAEANLLFQQVVAELESGVDPDSRYLRGYCEYYRPSVEADYRMQQINEAKKLEAETPLRHFFPIEDFDLQRVKLHFQEMRPAYERVTVRRSTSD